MVKRPAVVRVKEGRSNKIVKPKPESFSQVWRQVSGNLIGRTRKERREKAKRVYKLAVREWKKKEREREEQGQGEES